MLFDLQQLIVITKRRPITADIGPGDINEGRKFELSASVAQTAANKHTYRPRQHKRRPTNTFIGLRKQSAPGPRHPPHKKSPSIPWRGFQINRINNYSPLPSLNVSETCHMPFSNWKQRLILFNVSE